MAGPIFPREEFDTRYQLVRDRMEPLRLDAVVAYSPGNQFWLTGCVGPRHQQSRDHLWLRYLIPPRWCSPPKGSRP